jgi:transcriptional regulator of acetoin/glycerol metabolism
MFHHINADALAAVRTYRWPGNLRELRNCLVRPVSLATNDTIGVKDLFPDATRSESETARPQATTLGEAHRTPSGNTFSQLLRTAHSLGISRVTLGTKNEAFRIVGSEPDRGRAASFMRITNPARRSFLNGAS